MARVAEVKSSPDESQKVVARACLEWAESIDILLADTCGLKLFRSFLADEYVTHPLDFYLACVGLRKSGAVSRDQERLRMVLKSLYRKYLRTNSECFVPLPDDVRRKLQAQIGAQGDDFMATWSAIVGAAQDAVKALLQRSLYQQFLKSDHYVKHLQKFFPVVEAKADESDEVGGENGSSQPIGNVTLPTLHEDSELRAEDCVLLQATPASSLMTSQTEAGDKQVGKMLPPQPPSTRPTMAANAKPFNPYYISYYTTVSTIDSERQSMSSDAQTDAEIQASLTDSSMGSYRQRWHERRHQKANGASRRKVNQPMAVSSHHGSFSDASHAPSSSSLRMNASFGGVPQASVIPYHINHAHNNSAHHHSMSSSASLRLSSVPTQLPNNRDSLLKYQPFIPRGERPSKLINLAQDSPAEFARILASKLEKVLVDREKEERIERCLRECAANLATTNEQASTDDATSASTSQSMSQSLRRSSAKISSSLAKFVQSLSSEHDDDTADEHAQSILEEHMSRVWDKTVCVDSPHLGIQQALLTMSASHHAQPSNGGHVQQSPAVAFSRSFHGPTTTPPVRISQTTPNGRTRLQKVTNPEVLSISSYDSGAVTSAHPTSRNLLFHGNRQQLIVDPNGHFDSGISIADTESAKSLPPFSSTAKQKVLSWMMHNDKTSRASSVAIATDLPASFAMPPPPPPVNQSPFTQLVGGTHSDSDTQTRSSGNQRLQGTVSRSRSKRSNDSKHGDGETSSSTCGGGSSTINNAPSVGSHEYTTVAYKFSDEEIPYRSQLPGRNVTLRQFKQLITKRGVFRFYFKHATNEFPGGCVNEEVVSDDVVLPLFDGKIFARVERIEPPTGSAMS